VAPAHHFNCHEFGDQRVWWEIGQDTQLVQASINRAKCWMVSAGAGLGI